MSSSPGEGCRRAEEGAQELSRRTQHQRCQLPGLWAREGTTRARLWTPCCPPARMLCPSVAPRGPGTMTVTAGRTEPGAAGLGGSS